MTYNKEPLHEKVNYKTRKWKITKIAPLTDDNDNMNSGIGRTDYACNLRVFNGKASYTSGVNWAILNGYVFPSAATIGANIKQAVIFRKYDYAMESFDERVIYYTTSGRVMEARIGEDANLHDTNVTPSTSLDILNYHYGNEDVLLFFDYNSGRMSCYDGSTVTTATCPKVRGTCVYNQRVYGVMPGDGNKLRFSAVDDPFEWNDTTEGAGSLVFPDEGGALRKVLPCGENLYIFRDYAVYKLTGYKGVNDYSLTKIYSATEKIIADTVAAWNDTAFFSTDKAFYRIKNGVCTTVWNSARKLLESLNYASAICYDGIYYLTAQVFRDDNVPVGDDLHCSYNTGIIGLMTDGDGFEIIRGVDVKSFLPCYVWGKSCLLCVNSLGYRSSNLSMLTKDGKIYGNVSEKRWYSPTVRLTDYEHEATLRKIYISNHYPISMRIYLDDTYYFTVEEGNSVAVIPINKKCETMRLRLTTTAENFKIDGFEVEFDEVERRSSGTNRG